MKGERLSSPSAPPSLQHPTPRGPCVYGDSGEGQSRQGPGVQWGRRTSCFSRGERTVGGGSGGESEVGTSGRGSSEDLWQQRVASTVLEDPGTEARPRKTGDANRNGPSPPAACARRPVSLSVTPRTLARQAPLSWLQMYPRLNILVLSEQKHAIT